MAECCPLIARPHLTRSRPASVMRVLWAVMLAAAAVALQQNVTVDDDNARVVYSPSSAWNTRLGSQGTYSGGSLRYTSTAGASVSLNFNGSYIAYVADTTTGRGSFSVSLDGEDVKTIFGSSATYHSGVFLFQQLVNPDIEHTITIAHVDGAEITFDCFIYTSTENGRLASINSGDIDEQADNDPPLGLILGGMIGGSALVLSCIVLALVVAPPDPPQPFRPIAAAGAPSTRSRRAPHRHPSAEPLRPLGTHTPSHLRTLSGSDSSGSHSHSHSHHHSHGTRERNPFAGSSASLSVPYSNPFASSSRVDLVDSASGSSSNIPLLPQGRLPSGQGFICASCSVELARERTARMQEQNAAWAASGSGSGSRSRLHDYQTPGSTRLPRR